MKKIKRLLIALVLFVIIALTVAFLYIDSIAKAGIEKGATYALGVDTTLDNISLGIFTGNFGMDKLNVKNPAGFSSPHFFSLGRGEVDVTIAQLMGEKVKVIRIAFKDIDVHLEKSKGKTNYDEACHLRKIPPCKKFPAATRRAAAQMVLIIEGTIPVEIDFLRWAHGCVSGGGS